MRKLQLSILLCAIFVLLTNIQAQAGDLADILKEKGIITEEEAREAKEDKAREKSLKVLERIHFKGDLRLRHDTQWRTEGEDKYARNRERFRLRLFLQQNQQRPQNLGSGWALEQVIRIP